MIQYGTAGFRSKAEILDGVLYRMGILSVLRSRKKNGQTIGLMITASHNPECDNGVKLVDPYGEMLEQSWEKLATHLANTSDIDLPNVVTEVLKDEKINNNVPASVFVGQDTRNSSPRLSALAIKGIESQNGMYFDYGVVTTPMLHYYVNSKNTGLSQKPTDCDYYTKLSNAFIRLNKHNINDKYIPDLQLDGAHGVGALKVKQFLKYLDKALNVTVYNDGNGVLNHMCGADYVKVQQKAPEGVPIQVNARCVSVDGDADRLIYYYMDEKGMFHMLDGDRIATLIAGYLKDLVRLSNININLGLVQTAYANGSSTEYITNILKVPVACVPTGVKHLHHRATEFDIGVYFEANGHGTVVYSKSAEETVRKTALSNSVTEEQRNAAQRLSDMIDLTNQTVGDALSDILLVETVLNAKGWSLAEWEESYSDLPNRQLKVVIQDRNVIKTKDAERQCETPEGLQEEINKLVALYEKGRAFVRPSGTEDVVRVYSEASSQQDADKLGSQVALVVYQRAGGVGEPPSVLN